MMRKGIAISATSAAVLAVLTAAAVPAAAGPAPRLVPGTDEIKIAIVASDGPGCPPGTARAVLSDDREAFHIEYTDFTVRVGGTAKPTDARKYCRLSVKVYAPQGFTYAIAQTDYRLGVHLQPGARGTHKSSYYFHGSSSPRTTEFAMVGPQGGHWQSTNKVPVDQLVWKPCDQERNIDINTELRVGLGTSDPAEASMITLNSDNGNRTSYHFAWGRCP
ncbi:DUF4360 domain-containing protein [Actinomadura sp. KC216]|uniref:DUF4360 domain-containing protein n=1 Tax=Actinomadura sp. KC216 TaxID=2530370 RepID=UPI0014048117|nr:DUF4360 domain-containing protein [Actinomadura sp. KC216]